MPRFRNRLPPLTSGEGPTVAAGVLAISPEQVIGTRFGRV
jgi:hypothetical protein